MLEKGSFGLSWLNLKRLSLVPGFFLCLCKTLSKSLWTVLKTETNPVRFVRGPLEGAFLPGQSGRGR